ncbi:MAG: hypothetical protein AB2L07_03125 [Thermoanaerobaculaceae bacterium]
MFLISSLIFLAQRGFGGGHGRLDLLLYALALPWALIPRARVLFSTDYLFLVLLPLLANSALVASFLVLRRASAKRKTQPNSPRPPA